MPSMTPKRLAVVAACLLSPQEPGPDAAWTQHFIVESGELQSSGRNPYFILEPGYQLVLEHGRERLTLTVLDATERIAGVDTRVVEERETNGDEMVEVSRNFYTISKRTNSVFYFGEDVDIYRNGVIASHEGAWRSGLNGARFGLALPGLSLLGARYFQELAPRVAKDRARILSLNGVLTTPGGRFTSVLRVEESTPLEPGHREAKLYAPGVGLVQDASLRLVRYGTVGRRK